MNTGYVYILSNPSMPGLLKIGRTSRSVDQRANELYQTGVPTPFKVEAEYYTPDCRALEKYAHEAFCGVRVDHSREFFAAPTLDVVTFIESALKEQLNCLVSQFTEFHVLSEGEFVICQGHASFLADQMEENVLLIASAMNELTADELRPAMNRLRERLESKKKDKLQ